MVPPIQEKIKQQVIREWTLGKPRDEIAANLGLGSGTVTNIIRAHKEQLNDGHFDAVREFAVETRRKGLTLAEASDVIRLYNIARSDGIRSDDAEDFITDVSSCIDEGIPARDVVKAAAKLLALSRKENVLPEKVPELLDKKVGELNYIESKIVILKQEKERVEGERLTAIKLKKVTVPAIEKYLSLEIALKQHSFSLDNVSAVTNMLENFQKLDNDPTEILAKFSKITDLEHIESDLEKSNDLLQKRQAELNKVIKDKQDNLDGLETNIATVRSAITSLVAIRAKGIKDHQVISLGKIIGSYEYEIDVEALRTDLKEYKSLAATNAKLEGQNKELVQKTEMQSNQVDLLKKGKEELRAQLDILYTTYKKAIEEVGSATKKAIEEVGLTAVDQLRRVSKETGNATNVKSQVAT